MTPVLWAPELGSLAGVGGSQPEVEGRLAPGGSLQPAADQWIQDTAVEQWLRDMDMLEVLRPSYSDSQVNTVRSVSLSRC